MFELVSVTDNTFYVEAPAKIGLVRLGGDEVCLIDSGNDKDAGRKLRRILDEHSWKLRAIYNTHSNADHIGGNKFLHERTGCAIYAPGVEAAFTRHPVLEPSFLFGAFPPAELRHKFLLAAESPCEALKPEHLPQGLELIPLPGHFFDMCGYRTADDVVFLADCLSSEETLEKYQIPFIYDVAAYVDTLERVKGMSARLFVPSHAEAAENIAPLAQKNIDKVHEIAELLLSLTREPRIFEEIQAQVFEALGLTLDFSQYVLVGSTLRSFLSWLLNNKQAEVIFEGPRMLWHSL